MTLTRTKFQTIDEEMQYIVDLYSQRKITASEELDMIDEAMKKWNGSVKSHVCEHCQEG